MATAKTTTPEDSGSTDTATATSNTSSNTSLGSVSDADLQAELERRQADADAERRAAETAAMERYRAMGFASDQPINMTMDALLQALTEAARADFGTPRGIDLQAATQGLSNLSAKVVPVIRSLDAAAS